MVCFFCSNPINAQVQRHVNATVKHIYKQGAFRFSDRNFHLSCFRKFLQLEGRPYNPHTRYLAYQAVVQRDGQVLYELEIREAE